MRNETNFPTYLVVKPAYGCKPSSQPEIRDLLNQFKDFEILGPPQARPGAKVNRSTLEDHNLTLEVRYGKRLEKLMILSTADLEA